MARPSKQPKWTLSAKGLVMLGVPLVFQLGLIAGLFYLHDRAEAYAIRIGNTTTFSAALSRFTTTAYAAMYQIDDALWHHRPLDAAGLAELRAFESSARQFKIDLHYRLLTDKLYGPIDPKNKTPFWAQVLVWLHQLDARKNQDLPPTQFERALDWRIDDMAINVAAMCTLTNQAAATASDSPQHKQAFEEVQNRRHVLAAGLRDSALLAPPKVAFGPGYWAQDRERWVFALVAGCAANLGIVMMMGLFFSRDIVQRLKIMLDNSMRLAKERPLHPRLPGHDEISTLDHSFHDMADALTDALQKQRAMIDYAQDVICSLDKEGKFVSVNSASSTVFGYWPDELVNTSALNVLPEEDAAQFSEQLKIVRQGNTEPFEVRFIRKNKRAIDLLWSMTWSPIEQTFFCVAHDITERKGAERLRQEVTQMVSHDLRSPLTVMQGFHSMLAQGVFGTLNDQGKQFLQSAEVNTQRMLRLINDLLDIEKMESGSLQLEISRVPLQEIFEQCRQSIAPAAKAKRIMLEIPSTTLSIDADADRVVQILINLLSNAVKFTPPERKVTLTAEKLPDSVEVHVRDEGRGIPASMVGTIFNRFKQVQSADGKRGSGFGLGLAICKALAELHGGQITVTSEEHVGSTFTVRIPDRPAAVSTTLPVV